MQEVVQAEEGNVFCMCVAEPTAIRLARMFTSVLEEHSALG
jgi:hypothetical protein